MSYMVWPVCIFQMLILISDSLHQSASAVRCFNIYIMYDRNYPLCSLCCYFRESRNYVICDKRKVVIYDLHGCEYFKNLNINNLNSNNNEKSKPQQLELEF